MEVFVLITLAVVGLAFVLFNKKKAKRETLPDNGKPPIKIPVGYVHPHDEEREEWLKENPDRRL